MKFSLIAIVVAQALAVSANLVNCDHAAILQVGLTCCGDGKLQERSGCTLPSEREGCEGGSIPAYSTSVVRLINSWKTLSPFEDVWERQ
ncbi:hypothetical protein BUE80_DR000686 [Diplocarpon rosae]|nr:hypothetical protein BUE80_DR000686 [Diplocarpon rosae]